MRMMPRWLLLLVLVLALGAARADSDPGDPSVDTPLLDRAAYVQAQSRLDALKPRIGTHSAAPAEAQFAKAQCWLDVSFHEFTRNDRSPFPQQALDQSLLLIDALERGVVLADETPLVNAATRLRPDLWDALARAKRSAGLRCAARQIVCAEVGLVHAGNEYRQLGWRHAQPYVQMAEDAVADAAALAAQCSAPAAAPQRAPAP
jgi:OOP family OmpA-OmpF porin